MFPKGNQINKGRIPWNKGITHTPEVCQKMSEIRKMKGTSPAQSAVLKKMSEHNKRRKQTKEEIEKRRIKLIGRKLSEEQKMILREVGFKKGQVSWNKGKKASQETVEKIRKAGLGRVMPFRGKKRPNLSGNKHWNWKGGVSSSNEIIRKSIDSKLWRKAIFERDNFTCIWCKQIGGELNADHILSFANFPEWRFEINNGRTLCKECHMKTKTYAGRTQKLVSTS